MFCAVGLFDMKAESNQKLAARPEKRAHKPFFVATYRATDFAKFHASSTDLCRLDPPH